VTLATAPHDSPAGVEAETVKETVPVKLLRAVAVIVDDPEDPAEI
jgi:hypothetical protein